MRLVAFGGLGEAGKSQAAVYLAEWAFEQGYNPVFEQFAGPLKRAATEMGFHKGGKTDKLYRDFCQTEGARARAHNPDWFVDLMAARLRSWQKNEMDAADEGWHENLVIIDDLRFGNERELVQKFGMPVFIDGWRRIKNHDAEWRQHESEVLARMYSKGQLEDETFAYTIVNNGTLEEFQRVINIIAPRFVDTAQEEKR